MAPSIVMTVALTILTRSEPGVCGCGVADTDTDGDGTADCNDWLSY